MFNHKYISLILHCNYTPPCSSDEGLCFRMGKKESFTSIYHFYDENLLSLPLLSFRLHASLIKWCLSCFSNFEIAVGSSKANSFWHEQEDLLQANAIFVFNRASYNYFLNIFISWGFHKTLSVDWGG